MVILHSTPSDSKTGQPGGGIQLSGVGESEDCQAVALAQTYMSRYYPQWSERYDAAFKSYDDYTYFTGSSAGKFSWNLDSSAWRTPTLRQHVRGGDPCRPLRRRSSCRHTAGRLSGN